MRATDPREQFLRACALDVAVRKPGNVSTASPGHGMEARHFLASAEASVPGLFAPGARVGARIEAAVGATLAVAGCNTNLGILLLVAPLARAFEVSGPTDAAGLQAILRDVLDDLDIDDARAAYRAIAAAHPGGLGNAAAQDVATAPSVSLLEAMRLAAGRDQIAAQYAGGYPALFGTGLASLERHATTGRVDGAAVQALFLAFLASEPDTHIVRKFGPATAQAVTEEARLWQMRAEAGQPVGADPDFAAWDESLKGRRLNPGTSADLTVATLFIAGTVGRVELAVRP